MDIESASLCLFMAYQWEKNKQIISKPTNPTRIDNPATAKSWAEQQGQQHHVQHSLKSTLIDTSSRYTSPALQFTSGLSFSLCIFNSFFLKRIEFIASLRLLPVHHIRSSFIWNFEYNSNNRFFDQSNSNCFQSLEELIENLQYFPKILGWQKSDKPKKNLFCTNL